MKILAGDIGGTKTRLALFQSDSGQSESGKLSSLVEQTYPSREYDSLDTIVGQFLQQLDKRPDCAGFGIAGPVEGRYCKTTNLPWNIDADAMQARLGISRIILMNDLEATAWGTDALDNQDFCSLQAGDPNALGNRMVIAAGTGLGQAGIYWNGQSYYPFGTEGGHSDFAPRNHLEYKLHDWLKQEYGHVSWERAVSGPGLVNIYRFLLTHRGIKQPTHITEAMESEDPAAVIATATEDNTCLDAMTLFFNLYAAETGNQALKHKALGGVYIGGGIAPKNMRWLQRPEFLEIFRDKGQMRHLMLRMSIKVILNDRAALYGPAIYLSKA